VIYFDEAPGTTWDLRYDNGGESLAIAKSVTTSGPSDSFPDGEWKTLTVTVDDAVFNRNGPRESDVALVNTDTFNNKFHLVEIRRSLDKKMCVAAYVVISTGIGRTVNVTQSELNAGQIVPQHQRVGVNVVVMAQARIKHAALPD